MTTAAARGYVVNVVLKRRRPCAESVLVATISRSADVDRLHFLLETQRLVNAGPTDPERVMAVVLERVQLATDAEGATVELVEGDHVVTKASSGIAKNIDHMPADLDETLSGQCVRMAMPLLCRDSDSDRRVTAAYRDSGARSLAVAPLVRAGEGIGVVKVLSVQPDHFNGADVDVIELMANLVASVYGGASKLEVEADRALRDPMTGLANRLIFMDRLSNQVYESRRYGRPFGLFIVDIDDFSAINASMGRDWGDAVLRSVAQGLNGTVRGGDTLARLEADQFVILCTNAERSVVEERLKGRIETVITKVNDELNMDNFELHASVGVVWSSGNEASAESLLTAASSAVSRAKRQRHAMTAR